MAILLCSTVVVSAQAKLVEYALDIDTMTVHYTGRSVEALAIGGQIPAPTIEATVGDTLRVTFHNKLNEESSVHWHGVLLPNDQDGVPWLTTQPIGAGASFTYEYQVTHAGTYWYHSHSGLQEQRGVYGALVFYPEHESIEADRDYVVVLSDWTDEHPRAVLRNLKKDGDYYARKKNSVQSWDQVLTHGRDAVKNRLYGAWIRMGPMDISDVGYNLFLANGKPEQMLVADAGERVRLRLINASASSYLNIEFAGGVMTIISADGIEVEPQKVKRLRMAVAETYDVLVEIPEHRAYALRATSEDGTGYSNTFIGAGKRVQAPTVPKPNPYRMSHGHHRAGDNGGMSHNVATGREHRPTHSDEQEDCDIIEYMTDYSVLRAKSPTTLRDGAPIREIRLALTGNMERYVWSFNGKPFSESDRIRIRKGENVRFVLENETMMNHPLHLHGHFFRVLNGQGEYSPLKHTVNVARMDTTMIEFAANEEKDWFFHCHNLYHMQTGMARVVSYEGSSTLNRDTMEKMTHDDAWYRRGEVAVLSQMIAGELLISNVRNAVELEYDFDYDKDYKAEFFYKRYVSRFLNLQAGTRFEREDRHEKPETTAAVGLGYVLPLLIETDLRLDSDNALSLRLHSDLQLTQRIKLDWKYEFEAKDEDEYRVGLSWEINKTLSVAAFHDSDAHAGVGLQFMF